MRKSPIWSQQQDLLGEFYKSREMEVRLYERSLPDLLSAEKRQIELAQRKLAQAIVSKPTKPQRRRRHREQNKGKGSSTKPAPNLFSSQIEKAKSLQQNRASPDRTDQGTTQFNASVTMSDDDTLADSTNTLLASKPVPPKHKPDDEMFCDICFEDVAYKDGMELQCGHWFCNDCWTDNMDVQLKEGATSAYAKCLASGCNIVIDKVHARRMLSNAKFERYEKFFLNTFVDTNPNAIWCQSPQACDSIIFFRGLYLPEQLAVTCQCGWKFCFHCRAAAHRPATCGELELWNAKLEKDGESTLWVLENTKKCPGCKVPIEKNEGCMHMTCTSCKHEFCWLCKGPWRIHGDSTGGYYSCNRYDPKEHDEKTVTEDDRKWVHNLTRFQHHDQAGTTATEKKDEIQAKVVKFEREFAGWSGKFLMDALSLVVECRYLLKYTYISAYNLPDEYHDKEFFQFLQGHLESSTERLYESLINLDVKTMQVENFKAKLNATRLYFEHMSKAIESGLTIGYKAARKPSKKSSTSSASSDAASSSVSSFFSWWGTTRS